jgi:hypothetical protein
MDPIRKSWNDRHKELRHALEISGDRRLATDLFLLQHAAVHSGRISELPVHSFADEVLGNLSEIQWRFIPRGGNHSIAWIILHLARVEDLTMNILVADKNQVFRDGGWCDRLGLNFVHTGNGMTDNDVVEYSNEVNIKALFEYRLSVGRETRKVVKALKAPDYKSRIKLERIKRIWDERAMIPNAKRIVEYWARRTVAGLLLMPPTRHCFLHLNEARKIKSKATKQIMA